MTYEFPKTYKEADFISSFENIACYSDKEVENIDGSTVTFKDGSIADLQSRQIDNKGNGKIVVKTIDGSFINECIITDD